MKEFLLKQKIFKFTDHYPIKDSNGEECYYVDQDFRFFGNTVHVTDRSGLEVFTLNREITFFLNHYEILFYNGKKINIDQQLRLFRIGLDVRSDDYDLEVKGDAFLGISFDIMNKDEKVASIERRLLTFADTYSLFVYNEKFTKEALAIAIAVDEIIDQRQRRS